MSKERDTLAGIIWEGGNPFARKLPEITVPHGRPLSINEMKDAIIRLYDESNRKNLDVFAELFAPDFVNYGGAGFSDLHGADAFRDLYVGYLQTFPDMEFIVEDMIAEGNMIGLRATMTGTHEGNFMGIAPPTGRKISWSGMSISTFNDQGQMDQRWQEIDGMSLMQQLGVIPTPPGGDQKPPDPVPPRVTGKRVPAPSELRFLTRRFIDEVWNKGNLEVADEIFHPEATSPSAPQLPTGGEGVKILVNMFRTAMPDYRIDIDKLLVDGDRVMARFIQSGTQTGELMGIPPTGKQVTWTEIGELRFAGRRVVESWYNVDMLGMMQQLGIGGASAGA